MPSSRLRRAGSSEGDAGARELVLTVVMALAAVGTAWAGFQSTKWSGVQANAYAEASVSRTEANQQSTLAGHERIVDVVTYTQWLDALQAEIEADPSARPGPAYRPRPGSLSGFLYNRFRPEFRPAIHAWVATRPLVDPAAPPTPFDMPEYRLASDAESIRLAQRAEQQAALARQANQRSDNYVLTAVFFALVLFFAGVASRARGRVTALLLIGLASAALVATTVILLAIPVEL